MFNISGRNASPFENTISSKLKTPNQTKTIHGKTRDAGDISPPNFWIFRQIENAILGDLRPLSGKNFPDFWRF